MPAVSVGVANVGTSIATTTDLTAVVTNSLQEGDLAYIKADGSYWTLRPLSTTVASASVVYADTAQGGTAPGRWMRTNMGGGAGLNTDRMDCSVNHARVDAYSGTMFTESGAPSPGGAYNNPASTGNKSILGFFGFDQMLLSALVSIEWTWRRMRPSVAPPPPIPPAVQSVLRPYLNLVVELGAPAPPGTYKIFVAASGTSPADVNDVIVTAAGPDTFKYSFQPGLPATTLQVVNNFFMPPPAPPAAPTTPIPPVVVAVTAGPPFPVVGTGTTPGPWTSTAFKMADILAVYPGAKLVDVAPGDNGLPNAQVLPSILLITGDSSNTAISANLLKEVRVNGVLV
jgi:hypothetical protein